MMGVNTLAYRLPQHKAFFDIDADCVGITENIPWEENKRFLDLLANSGTPLFISADPKAVTEEMKKDLRIAFQKAAQQKDELLPMDWMTTTIPEEYLINGERKGYQWVSKLGLTSFSSL
jgi:alpha-galactosidase